MKNLSIIIIGFISFVFFYGNNDVYGKNTDTTYYINASYFGNHDETVMLDNEEDDGEWTSWASCNKLGGDLLRKLSLKKYDDKLYEQIKGWCVGMDGDGKLENNYQGRVLFKGPGSGTLGNTSVPAAHLPIGFSYVTDGSNKRLLDIKFVHAKAEVIYNQYEDHRELYESGGTSSVDGFYLGSLFEYSDWAFPDEDHYVSNTHTLNCNVGFIVAGMKLFYSVNNNGNYEWRGFEYNCKLLQKK